MPTQAKVFVVSDTHFGHALMAQTRGFEGNIEAHDVALMHAWNATVKPQDTVWHLGDVYFRDGHKWLHRLNGHKKLVAGNHDSAVSHYEVLSAHFEVITGAVVLGQNVLTHIPVHPWQLERFRLNIHGHTHANVVHCLSPLDRLVDRRYVCVSVEQLPHFAPITLIEACNRGSV